MLTALIMTTVESMQVRRGHTNVPPTHAVIVIRRETYHGLLEAAEFFRGIRKEDDADVGDTVDELLVLLGLTRREAFGDEQHD